MKLVVQNLTGSLFFVEVEDDATVCDLRTQITAHQHDLPSHRLIFIPDHDTERLISQTDDGISLVDFGLRDGSHIYIFFYPLDDEDGDDIEARRFFFASSSNLLLF
uniref:Ubiquitin-like domain-containing protein n=1 Tax=Cucumis melo TaxID=3656 RepID=A0A9I9DIA1_CUCME